jgi:hypothetical protein
MTLEEKIQHKKEYQKAYREKNKEKAKMEHKKYEEKNKDLLKQKRKEYYENNKSIILLKRLKYQKENKEKINKVKNVYRLNRRKTDSLYNLKHNIRALITSSFKEKGLKKNSKTCEILGCSFDDFKQHLESKFESWMTWNNKGLYNGELNYGWDIDHIIPVSSGMTEEEVVKLNHFTNLQPLCSKINRDIKRNNIIF